MKRAYRKRSYPLDGIRRFLEPGPIVLVSSASKGYVNIMTMGWHMMLGFSPALFGCYIWEENTQLEMRGEPTGFGWWWGCSSSSDSFTDRRRSSTAIVGIEGFSLAH